MKSRHYILTLLFVLATAFAFSQPHPISSVKGELEALDGVKSVELLKCDTFFLEKYLVRVEQPVNHKKKNSPAFTQRVYVGFKGRTKPVVFVTEGYVGAYAANPKYLHELCTYLDANLVLVEHRFFGQSVPDPANMKYHTIEQSADDHHQVSELMKKVLTGPYISTGISKGGQTTMYYKYYFPEDMEVWMPYVGPLNFSIADERINPFINQIDGDDCRKKIRDLQRLCLKRQDDLIPLFAQTAEKNGYHFRKAGGVRAAFQYIVLEYPFAFWQWGFVPCGDIPGETAPDTTLLKSLLTVSPPDYFSDEGIKKMWPFFYQALTQIGYYDYDTTGLGRYVDQVNDLTFSFFNESDKKLRFKKKYMKRVDKFLKNEGNNMIFLYGEYDPWSATAFVPVEGKTNALKIVKPAGAHTTRIRNLPGDERKQVFDTLGKWLKIKVPQE